MKDSWTTVNLIAGDSCLITATGTSVVKYKGLQPPDLLIEDAIERRDKKISNLERRLLELESMVELDYNRVADILLDNLIDRLNERR
jgi:hypothetical protein